MCTFILNAFHLGYIWQSSDRMSIMWNINEIFRFFHSMFKPFLHWILLHPDIHILAALVHPQKVKRTPHLRILTIILFAIWTTFCYVYYIEKLRLRTLFLVYRKLKFLCWVCSFILNPEGKPVLLRKLKYSSISCDGD